MLAVLESRKSEDEVGEQQQFEWGYYEQLDRQRMRVRSMERNAGETIGGGK